VAFLRCKIFTTFWISMFKCIFMFDFVFQNCFNIFL
jgi:hypothetical protein